MTEFEKGQPVWVIEDDGSERAAEYLGQGESGTSVWLGGALKALVLYLDTREGGAVEVDRVIPREE